MSRKRIVVGTDERGRPLTAWAEPEAADEPRYGHMQPAFSAPIERRLASPTQRAWNGGPIQAQLAATPPTREEPTMPETPPQAAQEPSAGPAGADVQLDCLSVAAEAARRAWETVAVAQTAWQVASEDLARAYADVEWLLDVTHADVVALPPAAAPPKGNTAAQSRANGTASMLAKRAPKASPTVNAPGAKAREAKEKADRAERVMAAMERLGGDQRAVAADLGMRANAVAMVVKHARARAEANA